MTDFVGELTRRYRTKHPRFRKPKVSLPSLRVLPQSSHPRYLADLERDKSRKRDQIDIEIGDEDGKFGVFVENKIGSALGENQDLRYLETLRRKYESGLLVFITLSGRRKISPKVPHVQMRWAEVYDVLGARLEDEKRPVKLYLLKQFLNYMGEENMASFGGFSSSGMAGKVWNQYFQLVTAVRSLMDGIGAKIEDEGHRTQAVKITTDTIYFHVIPRMINKKILRERWRRNYSHIRLSIYPYTDQIYEIEPSEVINMSLYCDVSAWRSSPFKNPSAIQERLKGTGFAFWDDNHILKERSLRKIVSNNKNPKEQERRLTRFLARLGGPNSVSISSLAFVVTIVFNRGRRFLDLLSLPLTLIPEGFAILTRSDSTSRMWSSLRIMQRLK